MTPADAAHLSDTIAGNVARVIVGKGGVIARTLTALIAGGHVLVEDVPGVGKTMLARALAISVGGTFRRVQFTPDILPSDITGLSVYAQREQRFEFRPGPVFANVVLVDEINRASPRTQAALLEAMEERQVTQDGATYPLPEPFMVIATENPLEYEGVYPLPESELDRFLMRINIGYPAPGDEKDMVRRQLQGHPIADLAPVATPEQVVIMRAAAAALHVAEEVYDYALAIVEGTRRSPVVRLGASPRATIALIRSAQALALLAGREYVLPDDLKSLAGDVLAHRLILKPDARIGGTSARDVVDELLQNLPAPV